MNHVRYLVDLFSDSTTETQCTTHPLYQQRSGFSQRSAGPIVAVGLTGDSIAGVLRVRLSGFWRRDHEQGSTCRLWRPKTPASKQFPLRGWRGRCGKPWTAASRSWQYAPVFPPPPRHSGVSSRARSFGIVDTPNLWFPLPPNACTSQRRACGAVFAAIALASTRQPWSSCSRGTGIWTLAHWASWTATCSSTKMPVGDGSMWALSPRSASSLSGRSAVSFGTIFAQRAGATQLPQKLGRHSG